MLLVVIPALALAVVSAAAFAGRWVWWLDVLANFRPQYGVLLTALGLLLLPSRFRRISYGVLVMAAINVAPVAGLYLGSPGSANPDAPSLRVMSFNLLSTNESYADVIGYIETVDPDVVLLHESSRPWEVAISSAGLDYEMIRPASERLIFSTVILLKGEAARVVSYGFAEAQPRAVEITYEPAGWDTAVQILSTHPLAPTTQERAALRNAQLAFAAGWVEGRDGPFLVVGDFNATPWSWPFRALMATGEVQNSQRGYGLQASFPVTSTFLVRVPIDHLLHSQELHVRDRLLGPPLGSDHFPLIVDLRLAGSG